MDERVEDVDGDVLSALSNIPPRRKIQSFSQQLRGEKSRSVVAGVDGIEIVTGGSSSAQHPIRRRNTTGSANTRLTRNHSLEEDRINKLIERRSCYNNDSSDDDIFPSVSSTSGQGYYIGGSCNNYATTPSTTDFLDRIPSNGSSIDQNQLQHQKPAQPIPEFVATGGGKGIFNVPKRGAMHPRRPPSIELRPHPLRETQVGSFLRVIVCTQSQLWAGEEHGVRFWNFSDAYATGSSKYRRGDEDAAPFCESSPTSPTICMVVDSGSKLVWSGHQDGKIRLWKMDQSLQEGKKGFEEGLSWRASRGPILSMAMTSYGDLWSGTEAGIIKVWPWETIDKSLCLTDNERNVSSLLVERSYIDLRTQVTVNGVCPVPNSDVKYMLSDSSRAKVWSAGSHSFVLWDGRTRNLLKVFNVDGQIENNRIDMSANQEPVVEDEMKVKFVSSSSSKKEKSQSSLNFFQRSRNALIGAADAVRRVATKGGFGDDNRKIEALVQTADGMIWVGCSNGSLAQWDGNGNRIQEFNHHHSCVQCLCAFGDRLWVGYVTGTIQVLDLEGNLIGGWVAHESPIIKMAAGAGYIFTLANHGGIRGWNIISPGLLDNILRTEVSSKQSEYTKMESLNILIGTWNVGQGKPSHDSLIMWLGSAVSDVGLVIVGLQEVEMGAGFLAMSAARESVGLEGSSIGHSWLDTIGKNLDEGTTFERIGSRQLAGLLIAAW